MPLLQRWRVGPDSNRLPSAVLAAALPEAPPTQIAGAFKDCPANPRLFHPATHTHIMRFHSEAPYAASGGVAMPRITPHGSEAAT